MKARSDSPSSDACIDNGNKPYPITADGVTTLQRCAIERILPIAPNSEAFRTERITFMD